jgi:hypothetical protein
VEDVIEQGKSLAWQSVGRWSYFPLLFFIFIILLRGFRLRGGVLPRALTIIRAALQSCLLCLHARNCSLRARFNFRLALYLGKVTPCGAL